MDLFERINQQYEMQSVLSMPNVVNAIQQQNRTTIPQFQVNLTPNEQAIVTQRMSLSDNPNEEKEKWEQAILMSRQYDVPLEYAIDNLDSIVKYQTGTKPQYTQTFTRALMNSVEMGKLNVDRSRLTEDYYWARMRGDDTTEIEKQISELDDRIGDLYDYTPRKWYQQIVKGAAESLAYTASVGMASYAGNVVGNLIAPGVGTALSTMASFAEGYRLTKYSNYYDMIKAGVDPSAANWTATLSGGIQAAIESILGIEAGLGRIAAGGSANFVSKMMKNMYLNGTFTKIGLGATRLLTSVTSEGAEEFLQEITDDIFTNVAYTRSGMDAPYTADDIWQNSLNAFVQGAGSALILGGVGSIAETVNDVKYAKAMRADAIKTDSKQVFIDNHMEDEQLKNFSTEKRRENLAQTYDNINTQYEEAIEGLSTAEARTVDVDFIEQPENVGNEDEEGNIIEAQTSRELPELKRLDNGRLRVQESTNVVQMSDGGERHQLLVGSNDGTSNRYGTVTYTINEDGSIEINSVKTRSGYQSITSDMVQELARRNPGVDITWDPETEAQQKVRQSIIDNSPTGRLNWYEPMTDQREQAELAEKIGKAFTNLNRQERDVAAVLMQLRAQAKGMTANEYMDSYITEMKEAELGRGKLGRTIIKGAKAVIEAGKSSNFSTFAHETFHVIRNEMTDEENARLAQAFKEAVDTKSFKQFVAASRRILQMSYSQIKEEIEAMDGKTWNENQEEIAARMFESYLLNGKTSNSKLADLFSKIAEFFRKIYGVLRGQKMLNDNIVKAYDSLFERSAEAQNTYTQKSDDSSVKVYNQSAEEVPDVQTRINQSMTMSQFEDMVDRVYKIEEIEGYKSWKEWLAESGSSSVALSLDNEYEIYRKFLRKLEPIGLGEDFSTEDIINAYLNGTLTGTQKTSNVSQPKIDLSESSSYKGTKFYEPQVSSQEAKETFEKASMKITKANRSEVMKARADFVTMAHDSGFSEAVGISQSEINKKLRSWAAYPANAKELSIRLNYNVAEQNRWTGIENSNLLKSWTVTKDDVLNMVKAVEGKGSELQLHYLVSTMLALDTHIDYSPLTIQFNAGTIKSSNKDNSFALGDYSRATKTIRISRDSLNTVAHEIGHYLDNKWGNEVSGFDQYLTDNIVTHSNEKVQSWINHFNSFLEKIEGSSSRYDAYHLRGTETFARFVANFVEWTRNVAGDKWAVESSHYHGDNFNASQYTEFVKILQEKAYLDSHGLLNDGTKVFDQTQAEAQAQYDEVVAKYKGSDQWLKAPNGKDTKLTERQWVQVRTPNFKKWFGDWENDPKNASKVVDENGEPKPVYHGTNAIFDSFAHGKTINWWDLPRNKNGFWFSDNYRVAESYLVYGVIGEDAENQPSPNVMEVFLDLKNPLVVDAEDGGDWKNLFDKAFLDGNDGVVVQNLIDVKGRPLSKSERQYYGNANDYIAFASNQIKSATDNNGSFSSQQENIYYQTEDEDQMLMSDAKSMDREEFLDFGTWMYEGYSEAELNEIWNRAHGMNNDGQRREGPAITDDMTDDEKDEEFIRYFESDDALRGLINRLRDAYSLRRDVNHHGIGANSEEEYNEIVQDLERLDRFMREASPFFRNIVSGNGQISETSLKNIRTTMENAPRMYRDLYAEITGDENLRASVYDNYLPNIDEPGFDELRGMSIADRKRLSERIENETLKRKILSGEETLVGEAEKVVKSMDDEIAKLEEQLKQMQAKNNEYYNSFNEDEKSLVKLNEQLADAKHQLDEYNRKIRLKLDKSDRVNPKTITDRNTVQEKIDLLNEQLKTLRATDRTKAAEQRRQAIADLKQEIREKQNARREAKKVHDYKQKLASAIVRPVSDAVDYEYRQRIMAIQALVDPNFRQNTIWYEGKRYTLDEFRNYFRSMFDGVSDEELNEEIRRDYEAFGLTRKQAERLLQKNLNDFTVAELEQMAQQVADLADEGRQVWQAKQDEKRRQARRTQQQIIAGIMARPHAKTPDEMPTPGSAEDKKAQKNVRKQLRTAWFKTLNMDRKAQMLDNDEKGVAYDLLIRKRREVQANESKAKSARIDPVMKLMDELGVKPQDFYETVDITMNSKVEKFTYSDLFYGLAAQKEQDNYRAFVYGTLVTIGEKERLHGDNNLIEAYGDAKNRQFVQQAQAALAQKPDMVKVFEAMEDDLQNHSTAMAEFSIREYNTVPNFMDYYLPIYRADFNGTKLAAQMSEDVKRQNPGKNAALPSMGRWKERIDISANNQRPVHMDYFSTWLETVEEVEHTIATLGYERDLKRVFQNFGSENLKSYIDANFGRGMLKDIDNYINEVGNPPVYNDVQGTEKTIRTLRGNLYSAYLGFKASGIVLQAITSPAPTLGYVNPFNLARNLLRMTFQYRKTWDFVSGMSEFMKNRSMDPALDIVKREANTYTDPKLKRAYARFLEKGTMGLEVIDKWAVTASWMALYEKKLNEFEFQTDPESMRQAARYADEIIAETQPLADPAELAPLFKSRSEWAKAFMQFTTSMNVIWNNVTYDIIAQSRKKGTFKRNVGMLFGYALAGAILGAVQNGTGDEDKPEEQVRQFFYNMTTQFTGSVPVFGTMVDELAQGVITGEASKFYGTNSIFPGIEDTMKGLTNLAVAFNEEDEAKRKSKLETALKNMTKGVGLLAGVPTSALKELDRTFFDEDGFTFNPAALAGRRD